MQWFGMCWPGFCLSYQFVLLLSGQNISMIILEKLPDQTN